MRDSSSRMRGHSLAVAFLLLAGAGVAGAAPKPMSGDIQTFLNGIAIPGAGQNAFVAPSDQDIAQWRIALRAFIAQDFAKASDLADSLGYDVLAWSDTGRGRTYYVLAERTKSGKPLRGLGTYVVNPGACRSLSFQAPHAGGDANTRSQSVALFLGLNARFLSIAGTHRCSNDDESPCDGSTSACGASGKFKTSDVAHFARNFFEPASEEFAAGADVITIAIHGEGDRSPDVTLSNGTCYQASGQSYTKQLAAAYNKLFGDAQSGLTAASCNDAGGPTALCAESDVQGRYINGATNICQCGGAATRTACSTTLSCMKQPSYPERFIHLEQTCAVRGVSGCEVDGISYQTAIDAFASVFPCSASGVSVVNGASFQTGPLAPGMIFSLFGSGLGSSEQAGASAAYMLGGAQVAVCGMPARLLSNSGSGQINAVAPNAISSASSCSVSVSVAGAQTQTSAAQVPVVPQNAAVFLFQVAGADSPLTLPVITDQQYRVIGPALSSTPSLVRAKKGGAITIWATGLGLTTPVVPDNEVAPATGTAALVTPDVLIDGRTVKPLYAGHSPGFIGLYQINVSIPAQTASGAVSLIVKTPQGQAQYQLYVE